MASIDRNISFPPDLFKAIEQQRGDIPRSRFVTRILEKALLKGKLKQKKEATI